MDRNPAVVMNRRVIGVALAAIVTSSSVTKDAAAEGPKRDQLDCSRAMSASERYTCGSPFLRALLGLIDNEEGRLLDLSPMSATLLLEQQAWMANRIRKGANYALRDAMAARYREIQHAIDATKAALAQRPSDEDIHRDCVALAPPLFETLMLACRVEAVKGIAPGLVGQMQVWGPAQGDLALPVTGIHALAVLAVVEAAASSDTHSYKLIGWIGAEGASINDPLYVEGNGDAFLTIPKTEEGSGSTSTDVVLARPGPSEPWREIDASSWMRDLEKRLPGGLLPKSHFSLDLLTMRALTSIARAGDPNCCPSGGEAEVGLALKDDVLVIDSLVLRRPAVRPAQSPRTR